MRGSNEGGPRPHHSVPAITDTLTTLLVDDSPRTGVMIESSTSADAVENLRRRDAVSVGRPREKHERKRTEAFE